MFYFVKTSNMYEINLGVFEGSASLLRIIFLYVVESIIYEKFKN